MEKSIDKTANPSVIDTFLKGYTKGFRTGIENITLVMILGYTLVYILQATGLVTFLGRIFAPIMRVFGLPDEAFAVLTSAFFAETPGCATAAAMYANGELTLGQASILSPAYILTGTLTRRYARIVLVAGTSKKWRTMLLIVPLLGAALSLIVIRMVLMAVGIV